MYSLTTQQGFTPTPLDCFQGCTLSHHESQHCASLPGVIDDSQLKNGQIGQTVVLARLELYGEVLVQRSQVLGVVSINARDELLDVLRPRCWSRPVGRRDDRIGRHVLPFFDDGMCYSTSTLPFSQSIITFGKICAREERAFGRRHVADPTLLVGRAARRWLFGERCDGRSLLPAPLAHTDLWQSAA